MIPLVSIFFPVAYLIRSDSDLRAVVEGKPPMASSGNKGGVKGAGGKGGGEGEGSVGSVGVDKRKGEGSKERGRKLKFSRY